MQTDVSYWEYIEAILIFTPLACAVLWLAYRRGFFVLPVSRAIAKVPLQFKSVAIVFAIYLGTTVGVATLLAKLIQQIYAERGIPIPVSAMSWLQLLIFGIILFLFTLYSRTMDKSLIRKIWKDRSIPNAQPIGWDIALGVITWAIGFPIVVVIGQIADLFLAIFFNFESYEQVAVRYLKNTLSSPEQLTIALFTILLVAPIIEEFLFRGFLQTYFKRFMSVKMAICSSSLCFALFHFAPSQGIGNVSLVISLFAFALFLGFIYERQASLFASIGLHMTFNAMSSFRILFMPES